METECCSTEGTIFACWYQWLLYLLILMLIILMLIENRSLLSVCSLGDRKIINTYLTKKKTKNKARKKHKNACNILNSKKEFLKIENDVLSNIHQSAYISFLHIYFILNSYLINIKSAYVYANVAMLWMLMR